MEWHVAVGDEVVVDQVVVTVETAKATVDLPCPHAGRVHRLHGEPGQMLAVGAPLMSVATAGSTGVSDDPDAVAGQRTSEEPAALAQYREEEQAGSGNVLIGYGTAEGKRTRRRRVGADRRTPRSGQPRPASPAASRSRHLRSARARDGSRAGGPGHLADRAAAGPRARHRPVAAHSRVARRILRRRDVEAAIARRRESVHRAVHPATAAARACRPRRLPRPRRHSATDRCRGRPAHPAAGHAPDHRRQDDHQPSRDPRRDHLGRRRRDRADGGQGRDPGAATPTRGIGVLALMARIVVAGLRRFPELNARVDTEREEIVQLARVNLGFAAQTDRAASSSRWSTTPPR